MLPYGLIARTQKLFGGLPVAAELTQHQIMVATALASGPTPFYAGLLHDILKPLFDFKLEGGEWKWYHLKEVDIGSGKSIAVKDVLEGIDLPSSVSRDRLESIIVEHHNGKIKNNPIRYVEEREGLGLPVIESTLLPRKELEKIGLHICVEAPAIAHPYHFFILTLLYQGLRHHLNRVYGEVFSKLGLNRLVVKYIFGERRAPEVTYEGNTLSISYSVPSKQYSGLHIRHEYGSDLMFSMSPEQNGISFTFGWGDVLTFMVPYIGPLGGHEQTVENSRKETEDIIDLGRVSYRIVCIIPGIVKSNDNISEDSQAKENFKKRVEDVLKQIVHEIEESSEKCPKYELETLRDYLEWRESGGYICIFCGRRTKEKEIGVLSEMFTDYPRTNPIVIGAEHSICPLCHIGYLLEEKFRGQGPSFILPLAAEPLNVAISEDFRYRFTTPPIEVKEGIVPSILGQSTLQLLSHAWYLSLLETSNIQKPEWIKGYKVRSSENMKEIYLDFMLTRKVLLYPLEIKLRPRAIVSSYGGKKKKFVLNTDVIEGHILWKGEEHDLTEDQLDALEPVLKDLGRIHAGILEKAKVRKKMEKVYSGLKRMYGLR